MRLAISLLLALALKADTPIQTSLCEIAQNPEKFDGNMVQVRATMLTGFEASLLMDRTCEARVWFAYGDSKQEPETATEYALMDSFADLKHPERLEWRPIQGVDRPFVAIQADSEFKKLDAYLSKEFKSTKRHMCISCPLYSVTATFIGRLDSADRKLKALRGKDTKVIRIGGSGFGHLNSWNQQLVMQSVKDIHATPIDPAIYRPAETKRKR
jgi:hypothetical protein